MEKKVFKTYSHSTHQQKGRQTQLSELFDVIMEAPSVRHSCGFGESKGLPTEREILRNFCLSPHSQRSPSLAGAASSHSSFEKGPNMDEENKQSPRTALFIDENDCDNGLHTSDHTSGARGKRLKQMYSKRSSRRKFGRGYSSAKRLKNVGGSAPKLYQKSGSAGVCTVFQNVNGLNEQMLTIRQHHQSFAACNLVMGEQSSSTTMREKNETREIEMETWRKDPFAGKENLGVGWNFVEKGEDAEHKPSFSLSESTNSLRFSPPSTHTPTIFSFEQQWKPEHFEKRSFIKIKTPGPKVLSPLCLNRTQDGQEISLPSYSQTIDTSSYTSVYTWTTATDSAPQKDVENMQKENLQVQNAASLSLVQQPCTNKYLHSTAIKSNFDTCCLQQTPPLSPIVPAKDCKKKDATPSEAKSQVFPRRPHKVCTSASGSSRKVAPKCSTMLFASLAPDVGDISLAVSSIKNTTLNAEPVAGAQDATLVAGKGDVGETCQTGKDCSGMILTSTPLSGKHKIKFELDLSSLQSPSDCEICPLRVSTDVVHSDEIVAESLELEDSCRRVSEIKISKNARDKDDTHGASTIRRARPEKHVDEKIHNVSRHQGCMGTQVRDVNMDKKPQDAIDEVCPISTLGMSERVVSEQSRRVPKAGILLWIEPADSGFMDMLQATPPDCISLLSYQPEYGMKQ